MIASNNRLDLLKRGIARAQNGDKAGARELFEELARLEPQHETVWLWLSSVAPNIDSSAEYLEKALQVDPANQQARQWLGRLRPDAGDRSTAWRCPLCRQHFTAKPARCTRCRALPDVLPIARYFGKDPAAVDQQLIEEAIPRLQSEVQLTASERYQYLAVAYLNLGQHLKALIQLGALSTLHPDDAGLAEAINALTGYVEQAPSLQATAPPASTGDGAEQQPTSAAAATDPQSREIAPRTGQPEPRHAPAAEDSDRDFETAEIDLVALSKEATSAHVQRPVVLVVDDSPTVRTLVSSVLEKRGYRTLLAGDGMEALSCIRNEVPDLVLLDVTMPHLDGFKICRVIKDNDLTAHVPVVFLSGKDGFLDKVRGRMAGAVDYLSKPVSTDTLLDVLERHCDRWIIDPATSDEP